MGSPRRVGQMDFATLCRDSREPLVEATRVNWVHDMSMQDEHASATPTLKLRRAIWSSGVQAPELNGVRQALLRQVRKRRFASPCRLVDHLQNVGRYLPCTVFGCKGLLHDHTIEPDCGVGVRKMVPPSMAELACCGGLFE